MQRFLHSLLHDRTRELASFLRERFRLEPPPEWGTTLEAPCTLPNLPIAAPPAPDPAPVFREFDDRGLSRVLELEETFPSAPLLTLERYRGYNIYYFRGRLYAFHQALGPARPGDLSEAELQRQREAGRCFLASSLAELKERVEQHVFDRTRDQLRAIDSLQSDLRIAQAHISRLERKLDEAVRLRPVRLSLAQRLQNAWRRLRVSFLSNPADNDLICGVEPGAVRRRGRK